MIIALDESYRQACTEFLTDHQLLFFDGPSMERDTIVQAWREIQIVAVRRPLPFLVDRAVIELLPSLQLVHKSGTGIEGFDLKALSEQGVLLANNRGVNASCVAEHIVLLTLLCLRSSFQYLANMRTGVWQQSSLHAAVYQLEGKTIGIVGMGAIGCEVAKRMAAFGTHILGYQRRPSLDASILGGVSWVPLDDLLRESDVVTVNVPLTKETERLISARELGLMKPTAVLINTSRGRVVEEQALYEALTKGRLWAAGLDVFEQEPTPADSLLLRLQNVLATPHIAGRSIEMNREQIVATMRALQSFLAGRRPHNLLNPEILEGGSARSGPLQ